MSEKMERKKLLEAVLEAAKKFIQATAKKTKCQQEKFRIICHGKKTCVHYQHCLIYGKFVASWIEFQKKVKACEERETK